jgi:isopentenyldiphosphate isomerase
MEEIKIYDANLREQGVMDRKEAHAVGAWHTTFHCWVVGRQEKALLFQLRAKNKKNYPDMFDVSAAGHILASESVEDGIRKVSEELGVNIPIEKMHSLGYRVEVDDQDNGQKNREYQAVYLAETPVVLSEFKPQVEEVAGLMWMNVDDALRLFSSAVETVEMSGIVYDEAKQTWVSMSRTVSKADFIPRIQNYYLTITIMAERLLENKRHFSIS